MSRRSVAISNMDSITEGVFVVGSDEVTHGAFFIRVTP